MMSEKVLVSVRAPFVTALRFPERQGRDRYNSRRRIRLAPGNAWVCVLKFERVVLNCDAKMYQKDGRQAISLQLDVEYVVGTTD